jgi:hypothetical protein
MPPGLIIASFKCVNVKSCDDSSADSPAEVAPPSDSIFSARIISQYLKLRRPVIDNFEPRDLHKNINHRLGYQTLNRRTANMIDDDGQ